MFYAGKSAGSRNLVLEHLRGKWSMLIQCEVYEEGHSTYCKSVRCDGTSPNRFDGFI